MLNCAGLPGRRRRQTGGALDALVRLRFLIFAVLFNLPGNVAIGGGGGVALLAGMSKVFSLPAYLLTVALAVAPVPLLVYVAG